MTLDEFFVELEKTPRDWTLIEGRYIRRMISPFTETCPVCEVDPNPMTKLAYTQAGIHLGMEYADAVAVARAADRSEAHSPELRQRLLKACGLEAP